MNVDDQKHDDATTRTNMMESNLVDLTASSTKELLQSVEAKPTNGTHYTFCWCSHQQGLIISDSHQNSVDTSRKNIQ